MDALTKLLRLLSNDKFIARQIKRELKRKDYLSKRLDRINNEIIYWVESRDTCNFSSKRDFCTRMANIYEKRYHWYIKNKYNA